MTITVDWLTYVINIPKADLTLIQSSPTEIREMNLNWFRMQLHDIMDDEEGICKPKMFEHNTEVSLGGLTYARVIEILDPYSIEFEDGQYAVNLVGANSNVGDKVVVNQVSVRSQNSAGLISSADIEFASYNGGVTVDTSSPYTGTLHPVGTARQPVNNLDDALLIAEYRGLTAFYILGDITVGDALDFKQYSFFGESIDKTTITIETETDVEQCEFYEASVQGVLDGQTKLKNCLVKDINYISGYIELCVLAGTATLGGESDAFFLDCWAGTKKANPPIIDMGGSGQTLVMQNFNGAIKIVNKNGANDECNISLNAGMIVLDSTVTAGDINIMGTGAVFDYSDGANVDTTYLVSPSNISEAVAEYDYEDAMTLQEMIRIIFAATAGSSAGAGTSIFEYKSKDGNTVRVRATFDANGNRQITLLDGT